MIKLYMVFINSGFDGVRYFQNLENAEKFAEQIGEKAEAGAATPQEYFSLLFDDADGSELVENIGVPFSAFDF